MITAVKSASTTRKTSKAQAPRTRASSNKVTPPIVGIGASAGGLEAIEKFLENVPAASGIGYVVIQHLAPTFKGMLPELLQRKTAMKVVQAANRMKVQPDCVYVIPPNKDLSILHGVLHLLDPIAPRGLRLPIDSFLRALAEDRHEYAVGVILSGMGSDGTLGLRAIKERAGIALVQEPATAKFDVMPRNAIDAGLADYIGPVEEMPHKIIGYLRHRTPASRIEPALTGDSHDALEKILILLRERTGNDFSHYKKQSIYRRIERRMSLHQIEKLPNYARYVRENTQEIDLLFKELLIGVTNFFRDPAVWEYLKEEAIPALLAAYPEGKALRAWVPACSTGEEAYSLAIVFREALEQVKPKARFSLQIFATDLDKDAIDKARQGLYSSNITADVSPARLSRFFREEEKDFQLCSEIRETIVFAPHNITIDPPFTKLDILTCRNLLIYLDADTQNKLIPLFHYALNRHGALLLGSAETIGSYTGLFAALDSKARAYRRLDNRLERSLTFPTRQIAAKPENSAEYAKPAGATDNFQLHADQYLLQNLAPAAVLVNADGDIVYVNGRTGKYLEPAAGKANLNVYAMAREGLRYELANALGSVTRDRETTVLRGLQVALNDHSTQTVDITVQPVDEVAALQGLAMITFNDVHAAVRGGATRRTHNGIDQETLERTRKEVQAIREEMQTAKEELTSMNEELQSANEELQSTNEELTTSKEEMQSMNEELQAVNAELQAKVDDLSTVNSDMKNLLNSTEIATIFLDAGLCVRRFTDKATDLFKLISGDVGRPLSDIVNELDYPGLLADVQEVLRSLIFSEKQIPATRGRWFKIRVMPYRTLDNMIDGVVITFSDITVSKKLEAELRGKATQPRA